MAFIKKYFGDLFLTNRFYLGVLVCIIFFICTFFLPLLGNVPSVVFQSYLVLILVDYYFLFLTNKEPSAGRALMERLSNGDENKIQLSVKNGFSFSVDMEIIDELPEQFQIRNFKRRVHVKPDEQQKISYTVKPHERGEYS